MHSLLKLRNTITKNELHELAVQYKENKNIFLKWATGCSKSLAALKCSEGKTLIICERIDHINNWKEEINKWNVVGDFTIICFQSLNKYIDKWDTVIIDEVDACLGPETMKKYEQLKPLVGSWIFLSADADEQHIKLMSSICKFKVFNISLNDAIKLDLLPKPELNFIKVELDTNDKKLKVPILKGAFKTVKQGFYTEKEIYDIITKEMNYFKELSRLENFNKNSWNFIMLQRLGLLRKSFLNNIKVKYYLKNTININGKKIIFTGDISIADRLGNSIHSKKDKKTNEQILDRFNNSEINYITCVDKLNRGMNLKSCQYGFIITLKLKNAITLNQQIGRVLRHEKPICYIYYVEHEKDKLKQWGFL